MNKPTDAPISWSTDTDYPAGSNPWNSTPTKVVPSGGQQAAGWQPSKKPPAQILNYMLWLIWQWLGYLANFVSEPYVHQAADFRDPTMGSGNGLVSGTYFFSGDWTIAGSTCNHWGINGPTGSLISSLPYAKVGLKIDHIDFRVRSFTASNTVKCIFGKQLADGTGAIVHIATVTHACAGGFATGSAPGGWETVTLASLDYEIEAGYVYFLGTLHQDTTQLQGATVTPA